MRKKLILSISFFILLLAITYYWLRTQTSFEFSHFRAIDIKIFYLGGILSLILFVVDAFRYITLMNSLNENISFGHALEASIINFFFAWTTPGAILAAPMTSYFLVKRKYSLEVSLLSSFGKSIIGLIHLLFFSLSLIYISGLYKSFEKIVYTPIAVALVNYLLLLCLITILAISPWEINFLPKVCINFIIKVRALFKNSSPYAYAKILISQAIYFICLIIMIGTLIHPFLLDLSWLLIFALSSVFLSLIYLSPTPGGVGLSELIGIPILGKFMPSEKAILTTLLVRFFIVYLPIVIGAIYILYYFTKNRIWIQKKT